MILDNKNNSNEKNNNEENNKIYVEINTDDIQHFLFKSLIERGLIPTEEELDTLSDVVFDYLVELGLIEEEISDLDE